MSEPATSFHAWPPRYLLFAGFADHSEVTWDDHRASDNDIEELLAMVGHSKDDRCRGRDWCDWWISCDWWEIVDCHTDTIARSSAGPGRESRALPFLRPKVEGKQP